MKNIAIALDTGEPIQRNEITQLFSSKGWAFWHWIDDFWIVQVPDGYTVRSLYEKIEELPSVGSKTVLVFEFKGRIDYYGRTKTDSWEWLKNIGNVG